eukprot:CAMPEP_0184866812 /NCGR_PEP_ID=MMETSP0580-20130426/23826_1 /TAXON_ID=1118495 /ORGANISM="Dactyliosolen fragilissimus" /LENGTH=253 /DNA_ID=CAMNT_0027366695 /DNA_START=714 /DNA_END=1472 /DNA_ORIENTATION=-
MAFVLGHHEQTKILVLNGYSGTESRDIEDQNTETRKKNILTDEGIRPLIPYLGYSARDYSSYSQNDHTKMNPYEKEDFYGSWEVGAVERIDNICIQGCKNLERLELHNVSVSAEILFELFQKCPKITHLSLSDSLDAISGPKILFCDFHHEIPVDSEVDNFICDNSQKSAYRKDFSSRISSQYLTVLDILTNLQYLDLSYCTWVNMEFLVDFIQRIMLSKTYDYIHKNQELTAGISSSLKIINILGCYHEFRD